MMTVVATLVRLAEPWASAYGDSPALQSAVTYAHFAGLLLGGGVAVATDVGTLRAARRDPAERAVRLGDLARAHRLVVAGLGMTFASGFLLLAADVEALLPAPVFWVKMGLVALLLANGAVMTHTEHAVRAERVDAARGWRQLGAIAAASLTLWFAALLTGTLLVNAGQ
jgi:hypothetical protein